MENIDVSETIKAKSDQLNSDDLIGGSITVRIERVRLSKEEAGPVVIAINGGHKPWKPCKSMRRVLVALWGKNAANWVGKWVELYRDPTVKFGKMEVGGIRIKSMSDIDRKKTMALTTTRGVKKPYTVNKLQPQQQQNQGAPTADLDTLLADHKVTREQVDVWLVSIDSTPPLAERSIESVANFAARLADNPTKFDDIRAANA